MNAPAQQSPSPLGEGLGVGQSPCTALASASIMPTTWCVGKATPTLPATTLAALPLILAARLEQIQRGHTPASDAATGPRPALHRLQARLHKLQRQVADALAETNAALDLTHGDITRLDPAHQRLLIDRSAKIGALGLAILENCMTILGEQ